MTTTTDLTHLFRAILENPADDTLRLVCADSLEESGDINRATFIRVQMELEGLRDTDGVRCERTGDVMRGYASFRHNCRCKVCRLKRQEYECSKRHIVWEWTGGIGGHLAPFVTTRNWRRGFVHSVSLTAANWLAYGPAIVLAAPVETVVIIDLNWPILNQQGTLAWIEGQPDDLKEWDSTSCIAWARHRAHLPPLTASSPATG